MRHRINSLGTLAFGTTLGGACVGIVEGLYRDVSPLYAGALYACAWAILGAGLALLLAVIGVRLPTRHLFRVGLGTYGAMLALGASALALVRFIVFRDLMHEAVDGAWAATAAGGGTALLVMALAYGAGLLLTSRREREHPRAWLLPGGAVLLFLALSFGGDDHFAEAAPPKALQGSGVILVVVDTLRADALGVYGAPPHREAPPTPKIDAFAARARVFEDVSAQASWTKPAVASIMTSRHPTGHATMSKPAVLPGALPTLAAVLQAAGVHTGAVVTNYNLEEGFGFDRGFDQFRYLPPARYLGAPARANKLVAYNLYRVARETLVTAGRQARYFYRDAETVNGVGLGLLDDMARDPDDRFFLWLHYMEPHDPYFAIDGSSYARVSDPHPPAAWAEPMHLAYRDEVRRADAAFGQLLQGLADRGLSERTTVVFMADHGEEFAEHGGFYHGVTLYEEQLAVPLLIAGPGVAPGPEPRLARQLDVAPTIAAALGVAPAPSWEGHNLFGDAAPAAVTVAEEDHEGNVLSSIRLAGGGPRLKLIRANDGNPRGLRPLELYDLGKDAHEQAPIDDDGMAKELSGTLEAARKQAALGAATAQAKELKPSDEAELRALGYIH